MSAKFEDVVTAIDQANSVFDLSRLPLSTMKDGLTDLQDRLQRLEAAAAASPHPNPPPQAGEGKGGGEG